MQPGWFVRLVVRAYPAALRRAHGEEIATTTAEAWQDRRGLGARLRLLRTLGIDIWRVRTSASNARAAAGRPTGARDEARSSGALWTGLGRDIRTATRLFLREPATAVSSSLVLAIGIGATIAFVSLADATLLHPLPIPRPDRVLQSRDSWSPPDLRDLIARQRAFEVVAGWTWPARFALERPGGSVQVQAAAVTGRYFALAGQQPRLGRLLGDPDDRPDAAPVVVIGERLWRGQFHADPAIVGQSIVLNRRSAVVVGVVPHTFRGLSLDGAPDVYVPLAILPAVGTGFVTRPGLMEKRSTTWIRVAGRLRDTSDAAQASADVTRVYASVNPDKPATAATEAGGLAPINAHALGLRTRGDVERLLALLVGAAATGLLLTCATVANLLLLRADRRRREFAVRAALGAGTRRLMRLLLTESLAIGLAGAAMSTLVAASCVRWLSTYTLPGGVDIGDLGLVVDGRVVAGALLLGLATSLVFGLAPIWQMARASIVPALRNGERGAGRTGLRDALVATQVAICVLLLGGGFAFGHAVRHALGADFGFDVTRTSMTLVDPTLTRYTPERTLAYQRQALATIRGLPWVRGAGWSMLEPFDGSVQWTIGFDPDVAVPATGVDIDANLVSAGYFGAMGLPIKAGRDVPEPGGGTGVVVNEALVRKYFPDGQALGRRVNLDPDKEARRLPIVGIVADAKRGVTDAAAPTIYLSYDTEPTMLDFGEQVLTVRSTIDPSAALPAVAAVLRQIDPIVAITRQTPVAAALDRLLLPQRLGLLLCALFGGLAVVVATLGLYAVAAQSVAHRRREIGLRRALGAPASAVIAIVGRFAGRPMGIGLVAGALLLQFEQSAQTRFLLGLTGIGLTTIAGVAFFIATIGLAASVVPIRRALAVDPAQTLRSE